MDAGLPGPRPHVGRDSRVGLRIAYERGLPREHAPERELVRHVSRAGVEGDRVVALVEDDAPYGVLGEDREGPALVLEVGDEQAVVRDQTLDLRGEPREKALGIERLLHGAADRRHRVEEVVQHRFLVHGASLQRGATTCGVPSRDAPQDVAPLRSTSFFLPVAPRPGP